MRCEVYHGIGSVDPVSWAHVTAGHPYAGAAWCRYGEAVLGKEGYYVILTAGDELVGGACFFLLYREQIPFKQPTLRGMFEQYLAQNPLLVCRTEPSTNFSGLFLPSDPALRQPALDALLGAAIDIARANHVSYMVFDYLNAPEMGYGWGRLTQLSDFLDVGTRLEVCWDNFEGYVEHLKEASLSRRKWLKRHVKQGLEAGIDVCFGDPIEADAAALLFQNVEQNYNESPYPFTREVYSHARDLPGATWMSARIDGKLVATELLLYDAENHICTPTLYGRDYEADNVYFHTYYEVIRFAIDTLKARVVIGNSGAYDFKHHLGFEPDRRNNLVFSSTSPLMQELGNLISGLAG